MCIRKTGGLGIAKCVFENKNESSSDYCPSVWDNFLCWPPTPSDETVSLPCPRLKGNDIAQDAFRTCLNNGSWAQRGGGYKPNPLGWTNFSVCINPYVKDFLKKVEGSMANISQNEYQMKISIAEDIRVLEMVGLALSIVSLIISLIIFYRFRNLQNNRTRIHKNLFIAMSIQVIVRLIVYIDQYMAKINQGEFYTIETTAYVCELAYILLEYARTAMFLWMFVEGLYLHNMITVAVFQERISLMVYYIMGWGSPVVMVLIWGGLTHQAFYGFVCWSGYNWSGLFWVLEGPRLLVITLNLLFLLNIIRVLITKLRESNSTEALQVRKAVRAAIVLLPLLGITNLIQMLHSPVDKNIIQFAIWSYVTTFLTSFQGFFCALIYCFLNGEVQLSVKRFFKARRHRSDMNRRKSTVLVQMNHQQGNNITKSPNLRMGRDNSGDEDSIGTGDDGVDRNPRNDMSNLDPFFDNWSVGELSSHHHVDVEQIEIPMDLIIRHGKGAANNSSSTATNYSSASNVRTFGDRYRHDYQSTGFPEPESHHRLHHNNNPVTLSDDKSVRNREMRT